MAVETIVNEDKSDLFGGAVLLTTIVALFLRNTYLQDTIHYVLAAVGAIAILLLLFRLRNISQTVSSYFGYVLIVFGFLLLISSVLNLIEPSGLYIWIGGAGIFLGLVFRLFLLDIFIVDLLRGILKLMRDFVSRPGVGITFLLTISLTIIPHFESKYPNMRMVFVAVFLLSLLFSGFSQKTVTQRNWLKVLYIIIVVTRILYLDKKDMVGIGITFGYFPMGLLVLLNKENWKTVGLNLYRFLRSVTRAVMDKNVAATVVGAAGLFSSFHPVLRDSGGELAQIAVFAVSTSLVTYGFRVILIPTYSFIIETLADIAFVIYHNTNFNNVLRFVSFGIIVVDIFGIGPSQVMDDFASRVLIGLFGIMVWYLSYPQNRSKFKTFMSHMFRKKDGIFFWAGVTTLTVDYLYFRHTDAAPWLLVTGILLLLFSSRANRQFFVNVTRFAWRVIKPIMRTFYNNFLYLTAWMISLALEFWAIMILLSGDNDTVFVAPFRNLTGPARIAVAGGLFLLGIVLFRETYSKNKARRRE